MLGIVPDAADSLIRLKKLALKQDFRQRLELFLGFVILFKLSEQLDYDFGAVLANDSGLLVQDEIEQSSE